MARTLGGIDFQSMHSLYYASHWYHERRLRKEAALRQRHGFALKVLDRETLIARFGIHAPVGLLTLVAAEADPYQFAHRLLARIQSQRGRVHARTELKHFKPVRGGVRAETSEGIVIHCRQLILAAGYECQNWLDERVARNRSSYVFASEPLPGKLGPLRRTLLWESARPYLYLRRTSDERLIVGGEDDRFDVPARRDARVDDKAAKLLIKVGKMFPDLRLRVAFAWAGTFAETEDGLPYFGSHEQHGPRVHFAMAYGGNGTTYSLIGAELLRDKFLGKRHPCTALFGFDRRKRR